MRKPVDKERGWKPDPKNVGQSRFWTGANWTQNLAPASAEGAVPQAAADVKPQTSPPPGWYSDGNHEGRRWWDGDGWTAHYENPQPPAPTQGTEQISGVAVLGYVFAFLGPFVGFFIGLALIAKNDRHAVGVIVASIVFGFLWMALVLGSF